MAAVCGLRTILLWLCDSSGSARSRLSSVSNGACLQRRCLCVMSFKEQAVGDRRGVFQAFAKADAWPCSLHDTLPQQILRFNLFRYFNSHLKTRVAILPSRYIKMQQCTRFLVWNLELLELLQVNLWQFFCAQIVVDCRGHLLGRLSLRGSPISCLSESKASQPNRVPQYHTNLKNESYQLSVYSSNFSNAKSWTPRKNMEKPLVYYILWLIQISPP